MDKKCRLCAKEKPLTQLGRRIDDSTLNLKQKLIDCCRWNSLIPIEYETLPKRICNPCYRKLEMSWSFAESVEQAQQQLLSLCVEEKPLLPPIEHVNVGVFDTTLIKNEPYGFDDELPELNESYKHEPIASESEAPKVLNNLIETQIPIEETVKLSLGLPNTDFSVDDDDDDDRPSSPPLLEHDLDFFDTDDNNPESTIKATDTKQKPKKRRYDARNIDTVEIQRKRWQKIPGSLSLLCDTCGMVFSNTCSLRRHTELHKHKKLECKTCGKRFRDNYGLKTHENTHTGAKPYGCDLCSYRSAFLQNVSKHMKQKHGVQRKKPIRMWVKASELANSNESTIVRK